MRYSAEQRKSRLKLRPSGVTAPKYEESHEESHEEPDNELGDRHAQYRAYNYSVPDASIATYNSNALLTPLKGLAVISLLALVIGNTNLWPNTAEVKDKELQANLTQSDSTTVAIDQGSTLNAKEDSSTRQTEIDSIAQQVINADAESSSVPTTILTTDNKIKEIQANNSSVPTNQTSINAEIPTASIDIEKITPAEIILDPVVTTPTNQIDNTLPVPLQNNPTNKRLIKTYRATIFSSLSANATETAIEHGANILVLEQMGDWVKVEVLSDGRTGFIHGTHLSN